MHTNAATALLLEDEPLISMDIEQMLEEAGFAVTAILSCAQAAQWLDNNHPDIAVVDILLRDGAADQIAQRLIDLSIPFIVHSGDHPNLRVGTPFEHGTWVSKPAVDNELVDAALSLIATERPF